MKQSIPLVLFLITGSAAAQPTFAPALGRLVPGMRANGKLELADVTGDGRLDAVMSDLIDESIRVMPQITGAQFADPVLTTLSPPVANVHPGFTLADTNSDGKADIAVGLFRSNFPSPNTPNIAVLQGASDAAFTNRHDYNNQPGIDFPNSPHDRGLLLADANSDGLIDLVSPSNNDFLHDPGCKLVVMLGDGLGAFGPPIISGAGHCAGTEFILVGDINADGKPDAVTAANVGSNSHARTSIQVNLGDGAGHFEAVGSLTLDMQLPTGSGNPRIFLADADGDGRADIFAFGRGGSQSGAGGIYVLRSVGDGTFTPMFRVGYQASSTTTIGVADLNGDGRPDIIAPGIGGGSGTVRVNDGVGGFAGVAPFPALQPGYEARDIATGSLDGSPLPSVVIMAVSDGEQALKLFSVVNTTSVAAACYANCDASTAVPVLTANDFQCFLNEFARGDSSANCDGSTAPPILNANDFQCFLNSFAGGCS